MKAFVITIEKNSRSVEVAERCIRSGVQFGLHIDKFSAFTPDDKPYDMLDYLKLPHQNFHERWSYPEKCISAFLSHFKLWNECVRLEEEIMIFEHDAVIQQPIMFNQPYYGLLSYGAPSYGKFNTPLSFGVNPLISKKYLPGAHAYLINPKGAKEIIRQAYINAGPTDVFLNTNNFPWLEEFYPWPVIADDSFTTIQREEGTLAKHNYDKGIEII